VLARVATKATLDLSDDDGGKDGSSVAAAAAGPPVQVEVQVAVIGLRAVVPHLAKLAPTRPSLVEEFFSVLSWLMGNHADSIASKCVASRLAHASLAGWLGLPEGERGNSPSCDASSSQACFPPPTGRFLSSERRLPTGTDAALLSQLVGAIPFGISAYLFEKLASCTLPSSPPHSLNAATFAARWLAVTSPCQVHTRSRA
jgi:hypothetical protein